MKRDKRTRIEKKHLTNLHNSKLAYYPEQCNKNFREPLEEIDQHYRRYGGGYNGRRIYESPMLNALNEKMCYSLERYNGRLVYDALMPRRDRDCESYQRYDDRTRFKQNSDRRDARNCVYGIRRKPTKYNSNKHIIEEGLVEYDFSYDSEWYDHQYYDDILDWSNEFLDCNGDTVDWYSSYSWHEYLEYIIEDCKYSGWDEYDEFHTCEYDTALNSSYRTFCEYEEGFNLINPLEPSLNYKNQLCPIDGRYVENELKCDETPIFKGFRC